MDDYKIDYSPFRFSFFKEPESLFDENGDNEEENEEEEMDSYQQKEFMEKQIPQSAIYLGTVDTTVEGFSTWTIISDFYIIPLKGGDYDWAIFRINWDDNWCRWEWNSEARMSGSTQNYKKAAKIMLQGLFSKWDIDLREEENSPYADLLNDI